jgi:hypothetical protein
MAMLTGAVNIAVFAAFSFCFDRRSISDAEFKAVWPIRQLDILCYGWQMRQDAAKSGKVDGKNGNVVSDSGHTQDAAPTTVME